MKNKFVNHARNVWDRTVTIHPRIDVFWYLTAYFLDCINYFSHPIHMYLFIDSYWLFQFVYFYHKYAMTFVLLLTAALFPPLSFKYSCSHLCWPPSPSSQVQILVHGGNGGVHRASQTGTVRSAVECTVIKHDTVHCPALCHYVTLHESAGRHSMGWI